MNKTLIVYFSATGTTQAAAQRLAKEYNADLYEIAPEDFALAEFADTSKLELQRIVREGLDKLRAEMS